MSVLSEFSVPLKIYHSKLIVGVWWIQTFFSEKIVWLSNLVESPLNHNQRFDFVSDFQKITGCSFHHDSSLVVVHCCQLCDNRNFEVVVWLLIRRWWGGIYFEWKKSWQHFQTWKRTGATIILQFLTCYRDSWTLISDTDSFYYTTRAVAEEIIWAITNH